MDYNFFFRCGFHSKDVLQSNTRDVASRLVERQHKPTDLCVSWFGDEKGQENSK